MTIPPTTPTAPILTRNTDQLEAVESEAKSPREVGAVRARTRPRIGDRRVGEVDVEEAAQVPTNDRAGISAANGRDRDRRRSTNGNDIEPILLYTCIPKTDRKIFIFF